ncbi:condensation domain-containing protein [Streptomyces swartbergensis]|uniref:condensation domain-containing protein n=1 Tax=Streptomyces swartbergensis TaxID=487165 RepID=UPI003810E3A7
MAGLTGIHHVCFSGSRSGTAQLTWGQRWMWEEMAWFAPRHEHLKMQAVIDLPRQARLAKVLSSLRVLVERREPLRTTFPVSTSGEPHQALAARGELKVEEWSAPPGGSRVVAAQLAQQLGQDPFTVDELPLRAGVVTCNGTPSHVVLIVFHLATDAWDMGNLIDELRLLVSSGGAEDAVRAEDRLQPLDQAAYELTREGTRACQRSLEYWRSQLTRAPADMLPFRNSTPERQRFKEVTLESEALGLAVPILSQRLGVSQATVLLSVVAILLGLRSNQSTACLTLYCNNRFDARKRTAPGIFIQDVPVIIDLSDGSLRDIIRRTWRATLSAYMAGQYDPVRAHSLIEAVQHDRNTAIDLSCTVNVTLGMERSNADVPIVASHVTHELVEEASSRTRYGQSQTFHTDRPGRRFYLCADNYADHVRVSLRADTTVLSTVDVLDFLRDIEKVTIKVLESSDIGLQAIGQLLAGPR